MGNDIMQYRCVIGNFLFRLCGFKPKRLIIRSAGNINICSLAEGYNLTSLFYSLLMCYIIPFILSGITKASADSDNLHTTTEIKHPLYENVIKTKLCLINSYFFQLLELVVFLLSHSELRKRISFRKITVSGDSGSKSTKFLFFDGIRIILSTWMVSINIILIIISNISLLNPGPTINTNSTGISFYYQNIQGFFDVNEVSKNHPTFNLTKLNEFQSYVYTQKPDVIILNETWLKPSITDHEILSRDTYNIFRLDRSTASHPYDEKNPRKFRKNGGGVFVAVSKNIDLKPKRIKYPCMAEFLSIEFTLPNKKKICVSTCYRVGSLGDKNHSEIHNSLVSISKNRRYTSSIVIGDFNLSTVNWNNFTADSTIHSTFVPTFNDVGLTQLISVPTHNHGNTLDLLLTNTPEMLSNIRVLDQNKIVKSDHNAITFNISVKSKRLKDTKRKIYNYKRANWEALNHDLRHVQWNALLSRCDAHEAWFRFKTTFQLYIDKHIPKVTVKSSTTPPWFDSEIHNMCCEKERARKKFKQTQNESDNNKFKTYRKNIKKKIKEKMRSNFDDDLCPDAITKKFWSFVKSSSKSSRLPQTMVYKNRFRNNSLDIASLFNDFFYDQFTEHSRYDLNIEYDNDPFINFKIYHSIVRKLLLNIAIKIKVKSLMVSVVRF